MSRQEPYCWIFPFVVANILFVALKLLIHFSTSALETLCVTLTHSSVAPHFEDLLSSVFFCQSCPSFSSIVRWFKYTFWKLFSGNTLFYVFQTECQRADGQRKEASALRYLITNQVSTTDLEFCVLFFMSKYYIFLIHSSQSMFYVLWGGIGCRRLYC